MSLVLTPGDWEQLVFLPSVLLGLTLAGVYGRKCWCHRCQFDVRVLIVTLMASYGGVSGILLMASTMTDKPTFLAFPTFVGGFVISVMSGKAIYQEIFQCRPSDSSRDGM